ncbi:hypothetical protein U1Q18_037762 [Sarracenia purpurea var. burkii]
MNRSWSKLISTNIKQAMNLKANEGNRDNTNQFGVLADLDSKLDEENSCEFTISTGKSSQVILNEASEVQSALLAMGKDPSSDANTVQAVLVVVKAIEINEKNI